jgi:hypothetical protein
MPLKSKPRATSMLEGDKKHFPTVETSSQKNMKPMEEE